MANETTTTEPTTDKKGKKQEAPAKSIFEVPADCLNEDGKIATVPTEYDPIKNKPIKKSDFADSSIAMDFRAHCRVFRADKFTDLAAKLVRRAERVRKFGDEDTRKKALKRERLIEALAAVNAELEAEGIDMGTIDD